MGDPKDPKEELAAVAQGECITDGLSQLLDVTGIGIGDEATWAKMTKLVMQNYDFKKQKYLG